MTMRLDGKTYMCGLSKLLAHELGHLFGSDHDGEDHQINRDSYYWKRGHGDNWNDIQQLLFHCCLLVPCPANKHLMSSSLGLHMNNWSKCTKKMVSHAYHIRKENNENCFYAWSIIAYTLQTCRLVTGQFLNCSENGWKNKCKITPDIFTFYMRWNNWFNESVSGNGCDRKTNDLIWQRVERQQYCWDYHNITGYPESPCC